MAINLSTKIWQKNNYDDNNNNNMPKIHGDLLAADVADALSRLTHQ